MDPGTSIIAAIHGGSSSKAQALLKAFVARWSDKARIVGVVEEAGVGSGRACRAGRLRSLATGALYPLFQDLGAGSGACDLEADGAVAACEAVRHDIAKGCDLVVLSKFGMLESERQGGLAFAFIAALEAEVPILTAVSPRFEAAWSRFAAPLYASLPPDMDTVEAWWRGVSAARRAPVAAAQPGA